MADLIRKMQEGHTVEDLDTVIDEVYEARGEYDSLGERLDDMEGGAPTPSTSIPAMDGTGSAGTADTYARGDHKHPTDTSRHPTIDSSHKLSADLVDDISATHKFATAAQLAQIETNKNNISSLNKYGGGKNNFDIDTATIATIDASYTKNEDGTISITKPTINTIGQVVMEQEFLGETGTYIISGCPSGGSSTTYEMLIQSSNTVLARDYGNGASVSLTKGTMYQFKVVVRGDQTLFSKLFKPMISIEGGDYQQYALSNAGLTNSIFEKIILENITGAPAQTITYTMKTSDFSRLKGCGIYMIYIVDWSTTPKVSVYAAYYSGGNITYSGLTKIAGADANVSVSGDTISVTTTGKVQITALQ